MILATFFIEKQIEMVQNILTEEQIVIMHIFITLYFIICK